MNEKLNNLINKLYDNYQCDLDIDEIRMLYELDYDIDEILDEYRTRRAMEYEDFCKLFGKDKVVLNDIELINENTICFIGDLLTYGEYKTYNLKYVSGNIHYYGETVSRLENLEIVYGDAFFDTDRDILFSEFDNLRSVYGKLTIYSEKYVDTFEFPGYVKKLTLGSLTDMNILKKVNNINGLKTLAIADVKDIIDAEFPNNVNNLYFNNVLKLSNSKLPDNLKSLSAPQLEYLDDDFELPDTLEELELGIINCEKNKLSDNLTYLNFSQLILLSNTILPSKLKKFHIPRVEYIRDMIFPEYLEELNINCNAQYLNTKMPSNIKKLYISKSNCSDFMIARDVPLDDLIEAVEYNKIFELDCIEDMCKMGLQSVEEFHLPRTSQIYYIVTQILDSKKSIKK